MLLQRTPLRIIQKPTSNLRQELKGAGPPLQAACYAVDDYVQNSVCNEE